MTGIDAADELFTPLCLQFETFEYYGTFREAQEKREAHWRPIGGVAVQQRCWTAAAFRVSGVNGLANRGAAERRGSEWICIPETKR